MSDSSQGTSFALYRYTPSVPAAIIFAATFVVLIVFHATLLLRHKSMFFTPFVIGLAFEAAGYIARVFSHYNTLALGPYIVQTMLILVAPPLFAASIYMTLGRLIAALRAEHASVISLKYLTKCFVLGDVVSFLFQCGGGGYMAAGSLSAMNTGAHIVIVGLAIQLLFFGFFIYVAALFHYRIKNGAPATGKLYGTSSLHNWESMMWILYGACMLIFIRSVFRVVEFVQGNDGYIMQREYLLYIFDALLMALQAIIILMVYPGRVICQGKGEGFELTSRSDSSNGFIPSAA